MSDERKWPILAVRGFKSIAAEQCLELRPLTILAGANSSGKSSIMQPWLLLKQTLECPADPGAILLDGPNVRFDRGEDLLSRTPDGKTATEFAVRYEAPGSDFLEMRYAHRPGRGFAISAVDTKCEGLSFRETLDPEVGVASSPGNSRIPVRNGFLQRDRCFLDFWFVAPKVQGMPEGGATDAPQRPAEDHATDFVARVGWLQTWGNGAGSLGQAILADGVGLRPDLLEMIHLQGLRTAPRRAYPRRGIRERFPGTFDEYAASVLFGWQMARLDASATPLLPMADPQMESETDAAQSAALHLAALDADLQSLGLTWGALAHAVGDAWIEVRVGRTPRRLGDGATDMVSIADVGVGVSQILPVVVALIVAKPLQIVYLEQPELHLHPAAQRGLARLLAKAAKRGVRVVAETHSELVLREIQTLVAAGELDPDIVKLHWFSRDAGGQTVVTAADLDADGAFGGWPEDFSAVAMDSSQAYVEAVGRRQSWGTAES